MPKIDLASIPQTNATGYPEPFDREVQGRWYRRLAPPSGMEKIGASHVVRKPGAWSSQRHWHEGQDEFLVMLEGEATLVEDEGETLLKPGDCAAFPAGVENGHHLQNRSDADCVFIVVANKGPDSGGYSDIDMQFDAEGYAHRDGRRYETTRIP